MGLPIPKPVMRTVVFISRKQRPAAEPLLSKHEPQLLSLASAEESDTPGPVWVTGQSKSTARSIPESPWGWAAKPGPAEQACLLPKTLQCRGHTQPQQNSLAPHSGLGYLPPNTPKWREHWTIPDHVSSLF